MSEETSGGSPLLGPPQDQQDQQEPQQTQVDPTQPQTQSEPQQTQEPQQPQQPQAPETYEPFAAPEGIGITDAQQGELAALGREMKLNQAQMQKLVDFGSKKIGDGMEALRLETLKRWREQTENDPDIRAGIDHARRLVTNVGDEKFREEFKGMIEETGIGYNPVFVRFCVQAGKLLGEDAFIKSGNTSPTATNTLAGIAHSLYPDM
jgi:hypothetical protein